MSAGDDSLCIVTFENIFFQIYGKSIRWWRILYPRPVLEGYLNDEYSRLLQQWAPLTQESIIQCEMEHAPILTQGRGVGDDSAWFCGAALRWTPTGVAARGSQWRRMEKQYTIIGMSASVCFLVALSWRAHVCRQQQGSYKRVPADARDFSFDINICLAGFWLHLYCIWH